MHRSTEGRGLVTVCESEVQHLLLAPVGGGCESWPPAWERQTFSLPFLFWGLPLSGLGVEVGGSEWGGGASACHGWFGSRPFPMWLAWGRPGQGRTFFKDG